MKLTVVLLVLLFLCEFGYGDYVAKLPPEEVITLRYVVSKLGGDKTTIFSNLCVDSTVEGITINCNNCSYDSTTTCHVEEITTTTDFEDGVIDERISNLSYLKILDLGDSKLTGNIPDTIGQLKYLEKLNLYTNLLNGRIPRSLGNLKRLKYLRLHENMLSGGIPVELGNLSNLITLRLELNNLNGHIPSQLQHLGMLEYLDLEENHLNGTLPPELGNLLNLTNFYVGSNNLTGELPGSYKNLVNLIVFQVAGNSLRGQIPNYIATWQSLQSLDLRGNEFTYLPLDIFQMGNLAELLISDLSSESSFNFPATANLSSIKTLVLRSCSIYGQIPDYVGEWESLTYLDLRFNHLEGMIQDSMENLKKLKEVFLTGNNLSGPLPMWIYGENITKLELSYNDLSPPHFDESDDRIKPNRSHISDMSMRYQKNPKYDSLYINCGGGPEKYEGVPYEADDSMLNYYEAADGRWMYTCSGDFDLDSDLDSDLDFKARSTSDYIQNMTCGISEENNLFKEARFCPISLSYYAFGLREGDYNVTLYFAETVFTKDEDYSSLGKRIFDIIIQNQTLENYNIKKEAGGPNRKWNKTVHTNVEKNHTLQIRLQWTGKGSLHRNGPLLSAIAVYPSKQREKKFTRTQIAAITVGSFFIPLLLLALAWKIGWLRNKEFDEKIVVQDKQVTMRQIIGATYNFSGKTMISQETTNGRFGDVYKAELKDQQPPITLAVKKLSTQLKPKDKIDIQIDILKCDHANLVQLYKWHPKKLPHLLIYEYMEKGSLHHALLEAGNETLDWKTKLDICLGIANGLKYLHKVLKIVHGNITAKNILLDQNNTPKLSEFGLATLFDDNPFLSKDKERRPYLLATMAPECSYDPPTTQADIYSFGHVMLEIVSGQPSVKDKNDETRTLMDKVAIYEKENTLDYLIDRESTKSPDDISQAVEVIKLAMKCLSNAPNSRPEISDIVQHVENIKHICHGEKQAAPSTSSSSEVPLD